MKIEIKKEDREKLLGLLPFSNDATEPYIPEAFLKFDKAIQPRFILKTFTRPQQEEDQRISLKVSRILLDKNEKKQEEKLIPLNQEIMKSVCKCIVDIENLVDLGTMEIKEVPKENGHITYDFFASKIPAIIQGDVYRRIEQISGMIQPNLIEEKMKEEKANKSPEKTKKLKENPEKLGL